jgi:hypothetical protein
VVLLVCIALGGLFYVWKTTKQEQKVVKITDVTPVVKKKAFEDFTE